MFTDFIENGSILSVLLMAYVSMVMMETFNTKEALGGMNTPQALRHPVYEIVKLLSLPCFLWPAVYVGLYSGWLAGFAVLFGAIIVGGVLSIPLGVKRHVGVHFIGACLALPVGYYLSLANLP
jgi:hypothetical protein